MQTVFFVVTAYSGDLLLEKTGALFDSNRHLWYFLVVNQYYAYLEEKETQKQQLGRAFQPQVFHKNYMKKKRSIIKLEILLLGMIVLIALFWR